MYTDVTLFSTRELETVYLEELDRSINEILAITAEADNFELPEKQIRGKKVISYDTAMGIEEQWVFTNQPYARRRMIKSR